MPAQLTRQATEAMRALLALAERTMKAALGGKAVDYARVEREVAEWTAAIECTTHWGVLQRLDVDREHVVIHGASCSDAVVQRWKLLLCNSERMKRLGSRWKEPTGDHVIQLRALALSDRWDQGIDLTLRPLRRAVRAA
jgi:hypothetical protein